MTKDAGYSFRWTVIAVALWGTAFVAAGVVRG